MTPLDIKLKVVNYLNDIGFFDLDTTPEGQYIYRQRDDNPKMDIIIEFVEHKDNL